MRRLLLLLRDVRSGRDVFPTAHPLAVNVRLVFVNTLTGECVWGHCGET